MWSEWRRIRESVMCKQKERGVFARNTPLLLVFSTIMTVMVQRLVRVFLPPTPNHMGF